MYSTTKEWKCGTPYRIAHGQICSKQNLPQHNQPAVLASFSMFAHIEYLKLPSNNWNAKTTCWWTELYNCPLTFIKRFILSERLTEHVFACDFDYIKSSAYILGIVSRGVSLLFERRMNAWKKNTHTTCALNKVMIIYVLIYTCSLVHILVR